MKTIICKIAIFALVLAMTVSFYGCKDESQKMTVVIGGASPVEYDVYLNEFDTSQGLVSVLEHLKETVRLNYEVKGGKLTKVGGLEYNTGDGTDICVYTSVESDVLKVTDRYTIDYNGATYSEIGVSVYDMTLEVGAVIYIGLLRYQ